MGARLVKLYIYDDVDGITSNYHDNGAVVIITGQNPDDVWTSYAKTENESDEYHYGEPLNETATVGTEPRAFELKDDHEEEVFVFPNAGCC